MTSIETMSEPIKPEWVSVMPDYTNLTISYEGYQKMMIAIVIILMLVLVIVGVVGWWLSASYQTIQVYDPHKTIKRIRDRPPVETVNTTGPDLSQSVVLYRGSLPKEWWSVVTLDIVDAPVEKCSYIPFIVEGTINPNSHTLIFSTHPFGIQEGRSVLKAHRLGHRLGKGYGVNTFPTRRGVWVMPLPCTS